MLCNIPEEKASPISNMSTEYFQHKILPVKNKLFRFACYYMRNREEAEDIVQEVMMKVWTKRGQWDEVKNMEAWCMQITKNMCLDKLRSKKGYHTEVEQAFDLSHDAPNPEHALLWSNQAEHLRLLVQGLPEKQKEALILREFEEMSYQEIADHLQTDMNMVKVNIHRARKTLQQKIKELNNYGILKS